MRPANVTFHILSLIILGLLYVIQTIIIFANYALHVHTLGAECHSAFSSCSYFLGCGHDVDRLDKL